MAKEMLINVSEGEECRIALVEDGRLEELYMERTSSTSHVGNVYKGRVTNVEPSIQAAFVDFGLGRNGFLHISDLMPTYFGGKNEDVVESVGRKMARRDRPPIQKCLKRGDEIVVQIIKEGIGTKGPTLSTYISIPGRILVMMPGMTKLGVSRKIEDEEERKRLRIILDQLKPPKDCGFIIRTAGVGKTKAEIERDLKYLVRLDESIRKKADSSAGPMELYAEGDLVTRTVRDVMTSDIDRIVVDNKDVAKKIKEFFKLLAPRTKSKVELYEDPVPLFHKYNIEREIELMYSRHVPLPSGGSLVIDSTEAIVAIDVNSGKFRDHADAETTAFKTDLEAADEIPRQLRLRDLGGVIICDFIDLRFERHRRDLERRLHDNLKKDRAKTKMLRMSQFGIIEMTRQRMRPSLKRSIYSDCPHCHGAGLVKTPESMSLDVMRRLAIAMNDQRVLRVELTVAEEVAFYLQNRKRAQLSGLEGTSGKRIIIRPEPGMGLDDMRLDLFDARDGLVFVADLGMMPGGAMEPQQGGGGRHQQQQQRGRGGQPQQGRGGQQQQGQGRDERRGGDGGGGRGGDRDRDRGGRGGRDQGRGGGRGGDRDRGPERGGGRDRGGRGGRRDQREFEPVGGEDDRYADSVEDQVDQREEERQEQAAADAAIAAPLPSPADAAVLEDVIDSAPSPVEYGSDEEGASAVSAHVPRDAADDDEGEVQDDRHANDDEEESQDESQDARSSEEVDAAAASMDDEEEADDQAESGEEESDEDDDQDAQPQGGGSGEEPSGGPQADYEDEEIELQPPHITHERPTLKEQARQGRRGGRGGGGGGGGGGGRGGRGGRGDGGRGGRGDGGRGGRGDGGRGGRGGGGGGGGGGGRGGGGGGGRRGPQQQQRNQPLVEPPRREGEMSLAERWAMEEAAERASRRQQGGGGGANRGGGAAGGGGPAGPQQPQNVNQQGGQAGGGGYDDEGQEQGGGRRRRRRRRGRGRGRGGQGDQGDQGGGQQGPGPSGSYPSNAGEQRQSPAPAPQQPPVQRTGSTDRHLLHDEPVMPQPIQRPRTYRDLDQIPDDLD